MNTTRVASGESSGVPSSSPGACVRRAFPDPSAFMVQSCGRSAEVEDSGLQSVVNEIARRSGYAIDAHRLELFGTCGQCGAAA